MRIAIFDPYLDTLGGGEKYMLTAASCLATKHKVEVLWDSDDILRKAHERFAIDFTNVQISPNFFSTKYSFFQRLQKSNAYDAIFYLSDGSLPLVMSKKLFIHFQFPVEWVTSKNILTKLKLNRVTKVICNSCFTKNYIDKTFGLDSIVIYPPSSEEKQKSIKKENMILSVGRYNLLADGTTFKKQELMIDMFKKLVDEGLKNWELLLVISFREEDRDGVDRLKKTIGTYPIRVETNLSSTTLMNLYAKAKVYWHAAGFGVDIEKNPELVEHFGIATVQAMEQGTVPIVVNAGGQKEIVENGKNGFLWNTKEECIAITKKIISDNSLWEKLSYAAKEKAKVFSLALFSKHVLATIK